MAAKIEELIDKRDNVEIVRDEVGAILLVEVAKQKQLAALAGRDPFEWDLRVFVERSNPWSEFLDAPDRAPPIVNVWLDHTSTDGAASNVVSRQKTTAIINIDCYAYGASSSAKNGHIPGDAAASLEVQRAVRLVRNILMAGHYTYLGLRKLVWRRMVTGVTMFRPEMDGRYVQQIVAARVALQVEFNELSPQVKGEPLELIAATVRRAATGEIYFRADYESGA